ALRPMRITTLALRLCVIGAATWLGGTAAARQDQLSPPPTPAQLQAAVQADGHVMVTWQDTSDLETGFRIQRQPNFPEGVITMPAGTVAFDDQPGRGFFIYMVWAMNDAGRSETARSNEVHVTHGQAGPHGPVLPDGGSSGSGSTDSGSSPTAPR